MSLFVKINFRSDVGFKNIGLNALAEMFDIFVENFETCPHDSAKPVAIIEGLYLQADRRLYGSSYSTLSVPNINDIKSDAPHVTLVLVKDSNHFKNGIVLTVEFDGQAFDSLAEVVRARLGVPGGMVYATVWLVVGPFDRRPVFGAWCCLDHRSLARSVCWIAAKLPALVAAALARIGTGAASPVESLESPVTRPPPPISSRKLLEALARRLVRRLLKRDQWIIQIHAAQDKGPLPGRLLSTVRPPNNAFWADPFLITHQGRRWLLFEDQPFDLPRAHIAAMEIDSGGAPAGPARAVLKEPWHLSYPFIWQEEALLCMIPESSANRSVDLYVAEHPLGPWRRTATLIAGRRLADATVTRFDGRLWMFAAGATQSGCIYDELHVFWAEHIEGPWHAHVLNPVKIDARSARPAGAMWILDGALYRVAQDCSTVYGGGIKLLRVDILTPDRFAETVLNPDEGASPFEPGLPWHTLNTDDGFVAIDVLHQVRRRLSHH